MTNTSVIPINELQSLFDYFNEKLYSNQLKQPIIIIGSKRNAYGWCSVSKVWTNDTEEYHEIGLTAEFLNRSYYDTAATLLHEMVHLYNLQNNIKDCSGRVHNKKFKIEAERRFMAVEKTDRYGWSTTKLTDVLVKLIDNFKRNEHAFDIYKMIQPPKETNVNKPMHYICPECGAKFQSKDEVSAICKGCGVEFIVKEAR